LFVKTDVKYHIVLNSDNNVYVNVMNKCRIFALLWTLFLIDDFLLIPTQSRGNYSIQWPPK